ncbi:hypothetical protein ALQ37_200218 [Pseudomonas syringae pv. aptata]|uniref:Uncharacterized protein n=1 Tax=Pseudomonas syringae pv. aptata TaxID=83167 RepID=A0A3M3WIN6_PSEAP|nr:hypothetical protein ALQ37_200218 [Pseudomonas syringae pv. aptata]
MDASSYFYSAQLAEISGNGTQCPPAGAFAQHLDAWRWVANPISAQCFAPVAERNPPRLLKETDAGKQCSCWALSMFVSQEQGIAYLQRLEKSMKMIRKRLGDHIAHVSITPNDGVCTKADRQGHFDLHPYAAASLVARVKTISPIPSSATP